MSHLTVHPEGVAFLKVLGGIALFLIVVTLRFSPLAGDIFGWFVERVVADFPPASIPGVKATHISRRKRQEDAQLRKMAFDCFAGLIAVYLIVDWLFMPETYKLSSDMRWPLALTIFLVGTLVIFVGSTIWDERIGWKKWTFWVSLLGTSAVSLWVTKLFSPTRPSGLVFCLAVSGLFFLWTFGRLRRIDRNHIEQEQQLNSLKQPSTTSSKRQR